MNDPSRPALWPPADIEQRRWLIITRPVAAFLRFFDREGLIPLSLLLLSVLSFGGYIMLARTTHHAVSEHRENLFRAKEIGRAHV